MAIRIEGMAGQHVAYLTPARDGPVLIWFGPGTRVLFAFNRPGGTMTGVDRPDRFGGTPQTARDFRRFAERFLAWENGRSRTRLGKATRPRQRRGAIGAPYHSHPGHPYSHPAARRHRRR